MVPGGFFLRGERRLFHVLEGWNVTMTLLRGNAVVDALSPRRSGCENLIHGTRKDEVINP